MKQSSKQKEFSEIVRDIDRVVAKKSNDLEKQQLSSLCSLPGIGEKFAVRMLEKFGTPLKVFTATTTELAKVEGLGDARAKKIKKILESQSKHLKESNQKTLHDA